MGYLSQKGKIGQYKGKDVYVYELSEIEPWMKHTNEMFLAILEPNGRRKAVLVLDGIIVGELDDYGSVNLYENGKRKAYVWPEEEPVIKRKLPEWEAKNTPAPTPVPVEVKLEKLVLDVSKGYGQYSKVVDGFFEGLEKLWQEIDVEIQGQGNL